MQAIAERIRSGTTLIAIDAPLGWPDGLRDALHEHRAGEVVAVPKDEMLRRLSDRRLRSAGLSPLEVGADRIARAAHEAATLIAELRTLSAERLPLLWSCETGMSGVIEVYPAATLKRHGIESSGYKKPDATAQRFRIATACEARVTGVLDRVGASADEFDACLCLLAAADFMEGRCEPPPSKCETGVRVHFPLTTLSGPLPGAESNCC